METLDKITERILMELEEKDRVREEALRSVRFIMRKCGEAVQKMHLAQNAHEVITQAKEEAKKVKELLKAHPDIYYSGSVESAFQELCEACIIHASLKNQKLPEPEELGVTSTSYLLGLGDAIGELRRLCLDSLLENNPELAKKYLNTMENFYNALMKFDLPSAIVAVRKHQDKARALIEKTRSELLFAMREKSLEKKIEELKRQ
ncbi:MAG: translin family protein [Candidatus Thermoplasmatota archaeon]|nr:translin family protein [Candidatus Thermoplasmatota archaeon]